MVEQPWQGRPALLAAPSWLGGACRCVERIQADAKPHRLVPQRLPPFRCPPDQDQHAASAMRMCGRTFNWGRMPAAEYAALSLKRSAFETLVHTSGDYNNSTAHMPVKPRSS